MGAPLCVGAPQWWVRLVVGLGLVSVSSVWLAAVCRVSSSAAPHGGLLWWCRGGGLGLGGSWEGAGHAGSGWLGGGGRVCCLACLPSALPAVSSSAFPLLLSFRWLVWLFFFGGAGWLGCCAWVWVCAGAGAGVGVGVVGDGDRVAVALWVPCVCAGPQASGSQGAGPGCVDGGWLAAVVAWRSRGWSRLLGSAWVAWPGVGLSVGVFMAWADGVVGSVGVVGLCGCWVRVRRRRSGLGWGTVGDAMGGGDAGDAYGGGCCRRRNGFVLLTWVLWVMRRAATGLVTLMVS